MRLLLGVLAAVALLLGLAGSAGAGFPGRNGLISVSSKRSRTASGEVYSIRPDGSARANLTRNPAADSEPVWSPDGAGIALSRDGSIVVMDADGSGQLTLGKGVGPAWSP